MKERIFLISNKPKWIKKQNFKNTWSYSWGFNWTFWTFEHNIATFVSKVRLVQYFTNCLEFRDFGNTLWLHTCNHNIFFKKNKAFKKSPKSNNRFRKFGTLKTSQFCGLAIILLLSVYICAKNDLENLI